MIAFMSDFTKILITGSTGFIGRHLISDLLTKWPEVKIVAALRDKKSDLPSQVEQCVLGDFLDKPDWAEALKGCDCIIHLAAQTSSDKKNIQKLNVDLTQDLVVASIQAGIKKFIFLSSIKVLGDTAQMPLSEQDQAKPEDDYARSKLQAENKIKDLTNNSSMTYTIIRPPLVYGTGVKGNFQKLVRLAKVPLPLPLGHIKNKRTLCAVNNLTDFILLCLKHEQAENETFCVADKESLSTNELLGLLARAQKRKIMIVPFTGPVIKMMLKVLGKKAIADRLFGNLEVRSQRAEQLLNWQRDITTQEALEKYFAKSS